MKATVFIILVNTLYLQKNGKNKSKRREGFIARVRGELHTPGAGTAQGPQKVLEPRRCGRKGSLPSEFSLPHSLTDNGYD